MIFPRAERTNTKIQIHKYTNKQIQHMTKCQKDPTFGIFLKRGFSELYMYHLCIVSMHHQRIISPSSAHHQRIISASSAHHQPIISPSSAHHQRIISASSSVHDPDSRGPLRVLHSLLCLVLTCYTLCSHI